MKSKPVYSKEEVIFYDTDSGGVVSNIAYLRFVEKARCLLFSSLGMDLAGMNETMLFPTVIRTEIDYRKPARLGDRIFVEASIQAIGKLRITCHFLVCPEKDSKSPGDRDVFAEAVQTVVLVQMPGGNPVRVPAGWAAA